MTRTIVHLRRASFPAARRVRRVAVFLLVLLAGFSTAAFAEPLEDYQGAVEQRRLGVEEAAKTLSTVPVTGLLALRERLRLLLESSRSARAPFEERRNNLRADLERLGPAPAKDAAPDLPEIAAERASIAADLARHEAVLRQADLNDALAERTLDDIAERRKQAFYSQILKRSEFPASRSVLTAAADGLAATAELSARWFRGLVSHWRNIDVLGRNLVLLSGALGLALVLFIPVRRQVGRRITNVMRRAEPSPSRRTIAAAARTVGRVLPGVLAGAILYGAVGLVGGIEQAGDALARTVWLWFLIVLAVNGAATATLGRNLPGWNLIPLALAARLSVHALVLTATVLLGLDAVLQVAARLVGVAEQWYLLQSAAVAVLLAVCILLLTRYKLWQSDAAGHETVQGHGAAPEAPGAQSVPISLVGPVAPVLSKLLWGATALSIVILVAVVLGRVALGYFLATRFFFLLGLVLAAWGVRAVLQEALAKLARMRSVRSGATPARVEPSAYAAPSALSFWMGLGADVLVLMLFAPLVFLVLGADPTDVKAAIRDAFFGIRVGNVTISLFKLLSAVFVFFVIYGITRVIQRVADARLFESLRIDTGVRDSFSTLIGYVGVVVGALAAIGTIGLDLSSIAIVAGALSVGIGFGLQSIVNNFVSGLILLFERPIKKGDWIVVPSGEGFVKRISVRSTEIQTFDKASVIVPNSELISGTVTNLTHGDTIGRVSVKIGVSYDEDPDRVMALLLEVATRTTLVMKSPEPFIYFAGFGDSSLDFEIRVHVRDVSNSLLVRSNLRLGVFKRLREAGVEIPYPHRTVYIRNAADAAGAADATPTAS
ncbi:MAG: mechanosensitive ion channel domain-containing protein [Lautropia sp.]